MKRDFVGKLGLDRLSGLYIGALFVVVFGIWSPHLFLTVDTLHIIVDSNVITLMLGIAVLVPLVAGSFDLSIGAVANLTGIETVWLMTTHHWSMWPAIVVAILTGSIIGLVNGFVIVKLHVNSFIATLGMATIIGAVQSIETGNSQPAAPVTTAWSNLSLLNIGGFQIVVVYAIVLIVLAWWFMDHTAVGRYLYATGANREAARLSGVRTNRWTWISLVISSTLSGIAGILFTSANGPSLTFGTSLLLPAFAAAYLGSTQLRPGRFNVLGSVIAVYVLAIGIQGLQYVTNQQWVGDMFNGVTLVGAVAFAEWRQRHAVTASRDAADATDAEPHEPAALSDPPALTGGETG